MTPNYAQDAPPTKLTIGGVSYRIKTDYRVWINVMHDLQQLYTVPQTLDEALNNANVIRKIEKSVFGRRIKQPINLVLDAITEFLHGYPQAPVGEGKTNARTYSFDYDLNYIILAIRNQSGIDLSYRRKRAFHWWLFLNEFNTLCGDHYILRLMEIRGYDGNDREMQRQAQRFALPRSNAADDQQLLDVFDALFPGA